MNHLKLYWGASALQDELLTRTGVNVRVIDNYPTDEPKTLGITIEVPREDLPTNKILLVRADGGPLQQKVYRELEGMGFSQTHPGTSWWQPGALVSDLAGGGR